MDLENFLIHLGGDVKTSESAQPVPLRRLACDVLQQWRKEQGSQSPYIFPSPRDASKPIRSIKRAWRTALTKADVPYFPIYNLLTYFVRDSVG
jgi:integrase